MMSMMSLPQMKEVSDLFKSVLAMSADHPTVSASEAEMMKKMICEEKVKLMQN